MFLRRTDKWIFLYFVLFYNLLTCVTPTYAQMDEEVEVDILEAIEVPGTAVIREERKLHFPEPEAGNLSIHSGKEFVQIPIEFSIDHRFGRKAVVLDKIGKIRGVRSSVKPVKAERPPYPRFAREQGWEGTVVLRLVIEPTGKVSSATLRESSGYPLLDESAVQAVQQWTFFPAKNGEFPVTATVDLPIRFDLDQ